MILAAGVGGAAAWGIGSTSAWILLPLAGVTVPLWPGLTRTLAGKTATTATLPLEEVAATRLPAVRRRTALLLAIGACVGSIVATSVAGTPTLVHLLAIIGSFSAAVGVWAWQFASPGSLGRRVALCTVGWLVGLSGNWVASATDCGNAATLIASVHAAAYSGAREGAEQGASETLQRALPMAMTEALQDPAVALSIAEAIQKANLPTRVRVDPPRLPQEEIKLLVRAIERAQRDAASGNEAAKQALERAKADGDAQLLLELLHTAAEAAFRTHGESHPDVYEEIAMMAEITGRGRIALDAYERLVAISPDDSFSLCRVGMLSLALDRDPEHARTMLARAVLSAKTDEDKFWPLMCLRHFTEYSIDRGVKANRNDVTARPVGPRQSVVRFRSDEWKRSLPQYYEQQARSLRTAKRYSESVQMLREAQRLDATDLRQRPLDKELLRKIIARSRRIAETINAGGDRQSAEQELLSARAWLEPYINRAYGSEESAHALDPLLQPLPE